MNSILENFKESGALMEGHFVLSSGLHSPEYLQCALALQYPADAEECGRAIAGHYLETGIETVASPAIGGLVMGYAAAAALNVRFIWTERQAGIMTLRRGFAVKPGERILVIEDVITTGVSTRECIEALRKQGADVVAAASIIDRSNGAADVGIQRIALVSLDAPTYTAQNCPLCTLGEPAIKP